MTTVEEKKKLEDVAYEEYVRVVMSVWKKYQCVVESTREKCERVLVLAEPMWEEHLCRLKEIELM